MVVVFPLRLALRVLNGGGLGKDTKLGVESMFGEGGQRPPTCTTRSGPGGRGAEL